MPPIIAGQASNPLVADGSAKLVDRPVADGTDTVEEESQWKVIAGALPSERKIYIPVIDHRCGNVISLNHYNPESGHFGALQTTELVSRDVYWLARDSHVCKHVSGCKVSHRIKAPWDARHGITMPFERPSRPCEGVMMDFVTDWPESTASGYTGIVIIVDRLTKMGIYLPCRKDIDSPELAQLFFQHGICKLGVPDCIVPDPGTQFTSRFWTRVCSHLSPDHRLLTSFHPQTDVQTEVQKQTMEQYLRAFCYYERDNWVDLLPLAKSAYHKTIHESTRMTPFQADYHYYPVMQFKAPKQQSSLKSEIQAHTFAAGMEETHHTLSKNLQEAQAHQTNYAGSKEVVFDDGYQVWLSTQHFGWRHRQNFWITSGQYHTQ